MTEEIAEALADARWDQPCLAYNLQARIPRPILPVLRDLQGAVKKALAVPLHLVPAEALHISLFAIVPVSWPEQEKEPFWKAVFPSVKEYCEGLKRQCLSLELRSLSIVVSSMAVIVSF
jgi:hypothetical protein